MEVFFYKNSYQFPFWEGSSQADASLDLSMIRKIVEENRWEREMHIRFERVFCALREIKRRDCLACVAVCNGKVYVQLCAAAPAKTKEGFPIFPFENRRAMREYCLWKEAEPIQVDVENDEGKEISSLKKFFSEKIERGFARLGGLNLKN